MKRSCMSLGCMFAPALLALVGCGAKDELGPPTIVYGQTECEQCRMIISDEPFAAGAALRDAHGVRKIAFDDIGCMLEFAREHPPGLHVVYYVHDHASREWIDAAGAVFVRSDALQTPMASQLAACKSEAQASALRERYPGAPLAFADLLATRVAADSHAKERGSP